MDDPTKFRYPELFYSPFEFPMSPPSLVLSHHTVAGQTTIIAAQMQVGQSPPNDGRTLTNTRWPIPAANGQTPNRHHSISDQGLRYSSGGSLNVDDEDEYRQPSARRYTLSTMAWNGAGNAASSTGHPPPHHNPSTGFQLGSSSYPPPSNQGQQVLPPSVYYFSNGPLPTLRTMDANMPIVPSRVTWSPENTTNSVLMSHENTWLGPMDERTMVSAASVFGSSTGPQRSRTFPSLLPVPHNTWNQPPSWPNPPPQQLLPPPFIAYSSSAPSSRYLENHEPTRDSNDVSTTGNVHSSIGPPPHRMNRPSHAVRHRTLTSSIPLVTKRKPLPKIYGCESCSKKFDRPSTLKVHEAIHTGAKDHLCEFCIRAFTVQSNMKRHMRVCKHKPLCPPFTLVYYSCALPVLTIGLTVFSPVAMDRIDRTNNLALDTPSDPAGTNNVSDITEGPDTSLLGPADGPPNLGTMIPLDNGADGRSAVRGYKAPMIIAAMFSVQHKVPNSISRLTLVQLECDSPLPPVRPHPKYEGLYTAQASTFAGGNVAGSSSVTQPGVNAEITRLLRPASIEDLRDEGTNSGGRSSSSIPPVQIANATGAASTSNATIRDPIGDATAGVSDEEVEPIDRSMRAKGLLALPKDLYEERNSYYNRSRYCYHPAEYDDIAILPGPGAVDLPIEEDTAQQS